MNGTIELKTNRLVLRKHRIEDAPVLFENFGSVSEMYEYSGWNPYASLKMAESTVQQFIDSYQNTDFYGWAIEYKGELIGTIGAYDFDPQKSQIEVGISIQKESWGKGFGTEALCCVLKYLTQNERITVVTAWCASENTASKAIMQKAGMSKVSVEPAALDMNGQTYDKYNFEYKN